MFERYFTTTRTIVLLLLAGAGVGVAVRNTSAVPTSSRPSSHTQEKGSSTRVSLAPKFVPGQSFRYHAVFETTTAVSHTGIASDPQGPASEVVTWDATLRFEVLHAQDANSGVRLRLVYEKSGANIHSDTFDPNAAATLGQYKKLEGRSLEFTFDPGGKLTGVTGLEGVVDSDAALQSARQWIAEFVAGPGAPAGGVAVGEKWNVDQPADSLPFAGMVWRAASQYVRDEPCPANAPDAVPASGGNAAHPTEMCAVIVVDLNLIPPKAGPDPTPQALLKSGVHTAGIWQGSAHSQSYISLRTGLATSIRQNGKEAMDVTFSTEHLEKLRYSGAIASRSQITLEPAPAQ